MRAQEDRDAAVDPLRDQRAWYRCHLPARDITTVAVPDAGLVVTGVLAEYTKMSDDGNRLTKFFCGTCGSTLFTRPEKLPGLVVIRAGTLDDRSMIEPQLQMYVSRAPAWDRPDDAIKSFPEMATEW